MVKLDYAIDIDLNGNQLLNAAVQALNVLPVSGVTGQIIYYTADNTLRVWDGTQWAMVSTGDIPTAYTSVPAMDGVGSAGSSESYARGDHVHPSDTGKVDRNAAITGGTKTKITFDSKGLVTGGADLSAADIPTINISKVDGLQTALDSKVSTTTKINEHALTGNVTITKGDVGLGNVDNTSDMSKPVSTATQTALDGKLDDSQLITSWQGSPDNTHIPSEALVKGNFDTIEGKIPPQASSSNQLADKNFVNSSIATNTAYYISDNGQPFTDPADLPTTSPPVSNNDYAVVTGTDSVGNTYYDRYKATVINGTVSWAMEYEINASGFTAEQWAAINSGITAPVNGKYQISISGKADTSGMADNSTRLSNTQNIGNTSTPVYFTDGGVPAVVTGISTSLIADATQSAKGLMSSADKTKLDGIATGAEVNVNADWNAVSGDAEILNKPALATVATSGSYNDLSNKPTIPTIPDITTVTSGSGNAITSVSVDANDKHKLNFTKGTTFLTQHQTVVNSNPTLAWSTKSKVGSVGSTDLEVTMPSNPVIKTAIESALNVSATYNDQALIVKNGVLDFGEAGKVDAVQINSTAIAGDGAQTKVANIQTGVGLTSSTNTIKVKLDSEQSIGTIGNNQVYAAGIDVNGKLAVNVPWENNKVQQSEAYTNNEYPILFSNHTGQWAGVDGVYKDFRITVNPSAGTITATGFAGNLTGNVTGNCSGSAGSVAYSNITSNPIPVPTPNQDEGKAIVVNSSGTGFEFGEAGGGGGGDITDVRVEGTSVVSNHIADVTLASLGFTVTERRTYG